MKTSSKKITAMVDGLRAQLAAAGSAERAMQEKAYLKSALAFHGVTVPFIRATAKGFSAAHPALSRAELRALVDALFTTPFHDLRSVAISILELCRERLEGDDLEWIEGLLRASSTWDHVDWLSVHVAGWLVERDPVLRDRLSAWNRDEHMWLRRASVLVLLEPLRSGGGDFALFERLAVPLLGERDFFLRKVVGWVLRDVSRKRPALTEAFLAMHGAECSGLTLREASKHLDDATKARLLAARSAKAPTPAKPSKPSKAPKVRAATAQKVSRAGTVRARAGSRSPRASR